VWMGMNVESSSTVVRCGTLCATDLSGKAIILKKDMGELA